MWNSRLWIAVFLVLGTTSPVQAQSALGRLFTTPAERVALNRARTALFEEQLLDELRLPEQPVAVVAVEEPAEELGIVQLTGIVRRADGGHTVWLNGVPLDESEFPEYVRLGYRENAAVVLIRVLDAEYVLKPGQSLDATQGLVRESYDVTPEQARAIEAEVAARAERLRLQAAERASRAAAAGDAEAADQEAVSADDAMVQSVIEGLRILQEQQSLQETQGVQP